MLRSSHRDAPVCACGPVFVFINGLLLCVSFFPTRSSSFAFLRSLAWRSRPSATLLRRLRGYDAETRSSTPSPTPELLDGSALLPLPLLNFSNDLHTVYVYCTQSFPLCQFSSSVRRLSQSPFMRSIHVGSLGAFIAPANAEQVIIGGARSRPGNFHKNNGPKVALRRCKTETRKTNRARGSKLSQRCRENTSQAPTKY